MKKIITLLFLFMLSTLLSVSVHAAGVAVGCGFTSNIGFPIEKGFDNSGHGSKYKAFKHKDGICMDLGDTKPNLCDLKLNLASNATQTVVIHVTFFSDIDPSTRRGRVGTEILTLRQRHSINAAPTDYSTWDKACASTSVETAQAYTKAIKNVRCIEIVHQYDSAGDYVNLYKVYIETNTPTNVTFKVYLYQGEKLNVGTDIGLYRGRVEVTVKKGGSEQAKDKIDAFFPVSYEEEYTISNMHSSRVQNEINPNRGDYWSAVPEFTASEDGLYNVTMHVTGSSYLLDAEKGLGAMYQGNTPADPPETSLRYVTIQ